MKHQKGFTLTELMVGIAVGLLVLIGAFFLFSNTIYANFNSVKQQQLEQTVQILMYNMVSEIRRAGYANDGVALTKQANGSYFQSQAYCATLSHSTPTENERFYGYKIANGALYIYNQPGSVGGADCTQNTNWTMATDPTQIQIDVPTDTYAFKNNPLVTIHFIASSKSLKDKNGTAIARDVTANVMIRNP